MAALQPVLMYLITLIVLIIFVALAVVVVKSDK